LVTRAADGRIVVDVGANEGLGELGSEIRLTVKSAGLRSDLRLLDELRLDVTTRLPTMRATTVMTTAIAGRFFNVPSTFL
jgi:hypothetical protein